MRRIGHIATAVAVAAFAGGCLSAHRSTAVDVDPAVWSEPAVLRLSNDDTLSLRDMNLFLRCNDRFAEDSFTVRIVVTTPDSLRFEEVFPIDVPRTEHPAALARERVVPYRRSVCFDRRGDYRVSITPQRPLRGVEAVGMSVVASTPPNPVPRSARTD